MRKIKFRAWDDSKNAMLPVVCYSEEWVEVSPPDDDDEGNKSYELCRAPVMQSTNMEDSNGKEIYEGDILSFGEDGGCVKCGLGKRERLEVIVWNQESMAFAYARGIKESSTPLLYATELKVEGKGEKLRVVYIVKGEVIGNIYENPELLEAKNDTKQ